MTTKKTNQIVLLTIGLLVCIVFTMICFTNSIACSGCGENVTGEYWSTEGRDKQYCKTCCIQKNIVWPAYMDEYAENVDNNARNVLLIVEVLAFVGGIFLIKKSDENPFETEPNKDLGYNKCDKTGKKRNEAWYKRAGDL